MRWTDVMLVAIGGAAGSVGRYLLREAALSVGLQQAYLATLAINVLGSFILGLLLGFVDRQTIGQSALLILGTGFCGGFTTFSAFSVENVALLQSGQVAMSLGYVLSSVVLGIGAAYMGYCLATQ